MKLSVKDYQIVKKADLEFVKGLNVIVGPSNNGKSSLLKAAKTAIFNELGTSSIRVGANSFMVGLQNNHHTVIFQKGLKESAYNIDGERYSKLGRGQLPQVAEALGIKELIINGNKETINFWDQMQYPFLLDRSSTDLYRFIVDSGEDDNLMKCLKDMVSDRQSLNKECNVLEGVIDQLSLQISDLDVQLEGTDTELMIIQKILELKDKVSRLNTLNRSKESIQTIKVSLNEISSSFIKLKEISEIYSAWSKYLMNQSIRKQSLSHHLEVLSNLSTQLLDTNIHLDELKALTLSKDLINMISRMTDVAKAKKLLDVIKASCDSISLEDIPKIYFSYQDIQKLSLLYDERFKLKYISSQLSSCDEDIESFKESINITKDLKSFIKVCPLCGQTLQ